MKRFYQIEGKGARYPSPHMACLYALEAHYGKETRITRDDGTVITILWPGQS